MGSAPDVQIPGTPVNEGFNDGHADRYVDWGAILAGALVASAISLILITFGTAMGLSFGAALDGKIAPKWLAIAVGCWVIWTAVSSSAAGGYFAGRMRKPAGDATPDEVDTRDGAHGVAVWAVAALITVLLASIGVGGVVKTAGSLAATGPAEALAKDNIDYLAGVSLRSSFAPQPEKLRDEVADVVTRGLGNGEVSSADRSYLAQLVANSAGIDQASARGRVDAMINDAAKVRGKAEKAANQARIFGLIGAFVVAASLLVSGAAAYFAAVLGGDHRSNNIGFATFRAAQGRPAEGEVR